MAIPKFAGHAIATQPMRQIVNLIARWAVAGTMQQHAEQCCEHNLLCQQFSVQAATGS